jgi:hypothetical protein
MYSALGLYWIFQSVLGIAQMVILARIYPMPQISEEEYELARQQYGVAKKKKKKKPEAELEAIDEPEEPVESAGPVAEAEEGEKYISKTIPKGISQNAKSNYQKTGKKYTIQKRKK